MTLPRRSVLKFAAAAAALPTLPRIAMALDYPTRPVRWIVGFAAGGAADTDARIMGQWLSERLGQQFVIENRTGAGGNIATAEVVRAAPDGYTLLNCASANAVNASLYDKLDFDFSRDIAPVAGLVSFPDVLLVNPSFPAKTVAEFIAYAKANPGKIDFASAGTGTSEQMAGELFKMMTAVDMIHIPFRGGAPAMTALIGGQVQAYFCATSTAITGIKAGMRPLAVGSATRWEALPDVPTISESVPGYEANTWFGLGAPSNTPAAIIDRLNTAINGGLADAKIKSRFAELGGMAMPMTPAAFGKFIADETAKWAKVVRAANIKVE